MGVALLAGCATRSDHVVPRATDPAAYAGWDCSRLHDEIDTVQQRAADGRFRGSLQQLETALTEVIAWGEDGQPHPELEFTLACQLFQSAKARALFYPGLRQLQDKTALDGLLSAVQSANTQRRPLLLKIAPDLEWPAIEEILALVEQHRLSGIIATNTTIDHSPVAEARRQQGGLSGVPLKKRALEVLRFLVARTQLPVIGVGGISSVDDALERLDAGAALLQIYTGLIYQGPALVREIHRALAARAASV
jgi:hypothetical protein